jgi:cytochrome c553
MHNFVKLGLAICLTAVFSGQVIAEGDAAAGRKKAETCLGCHGVPQYVNTYPTYHVPKLAGQHEAYIISALNGYRDKQRSHRTMHANAISLSEQDIANIAAYLSSSEE